MGHAWRARERQVAALPVWMTEGGRVRIGLVTSRETRRWIIPKGWPMRGLTDAEAARIEAKEEAGLRGKMLPEPIGAYRYWQRTRTNFRLVSVDTYLMRVKDQKKDWKEKAERDFAWVSVAEAAVRLQEPELVSLLVGLPQNEAAWRFLCRNRRPSRPCLRRPPPELAAA